METISDNSEKEIRTWVQICLKNENLKNVSVEITGTTENGDNYIGDVIFLTASGTTENGLIKTLSFVLKRSKQSQALRDSQPVKDQFLNEINAYDKILPYFIQFQKQKHIEKPFNNVPKCYGCFIEDNVEAIVLENLSTRGFELWPRKHPLSSKHLELVVAEYAKFHATSVAVQKERPSDFQKLIDGSIFVIKEMLKTTDPHKLFGSSIDKSYELLKNDLDQDTLSKWSNLKTKINFVFHHMLGNVNGLKVFVHGDCWNNNFMFLHDPNDKTNPLEVALLDFQLSRYSSPAFDLSYLLFACASKEDLNNLNYILNMYYKSFINHLQLLGIANPEEIYSIDQFLADWKSYSIYGLIVASLLLKMVSADNSEVVDLAANAEEGKTFSDAFIYDIRDTENYKSRIRPVIECAVKHNLI